ncbi:MAG: peptide chain release factor 2 [Acidobacteria bacterium]|nr:MAG: peptide chain release factor 2 [Acidobacteriota bacterium]
MIEELRRRYEQLKPRMNEFRGIFDVEAKRAERDRLEKLIARPDFWNDQARARKILRARSHADADIQMVERFERAAGDIDVMFELAEEDPSMLPELQEALERLERELAEAEVRMMLSGEHDAGNAIVTIKPGAGGTDAQDWAEKRGYKTEILDVQPGQEAGIKSAIFRVEGEYAYGYLKAEAGVHRLVRLSPFNIAQSRETSFASVFVSPEIEDDIQIEINEADLRIETFRASGAGGQHVNKTESAVRITHIPTGIVVSCQNQRSQHQNREMAMRVLRSRLYELELQRRAAEKQKLEAMKRDISFGSQIRSYVLHPYKLVKDLRTKYETSDVEGVLDGNLDEFIREYLLSQRDATAPVDREVTEVKAS